MLLAKEKRPSIEKNFPGESADKRVPRKVVGIDLEMILLEVIGGGCGAANFGTGENDGGGVGGNERIVVNSFGRHVSVV